MTLSDKVFFEVANQYAGGREYMRIILDNFSDYFALRLH